MNSRNFVCIGFVALMGATGCKASLKVGKQPDPEPVAEPAPPAPEPAPVEQPKLAVEDPSDVHLVGDHITIDKKIHFALNSDEIQEDSFELLDHIAQLMKNHSEIQTLHVVGHTDSQGDDAANMDLSKRRAASVMKALQERGVTQTIDSKGAGETELTCEDQSDECHEKNRRVEFKVDMAEKDA